MALALGFEKYLNSILSEVVLTGILAYFLINLKYFTNNNYYQWIENLVMFCSEFGISKWQLFVSENCTAGIFPISNFTGIKVTYAPYFLALAMALHKSPKLAENGGKLVQSVKLGVYLNGK